MPAGNDKLQYRAGNNLPDQPGFDAFNAFFGARNAVELDHVSGDIEVVPTPPPGWVRILDSVGEPPAQSFGQVAEIEPSLAGWLIWKDAQNNMHVLENIVSAAGVLRGTTPFVGTPNSYQHLVHGERIIFRPTNPGTAGKAVFMGAWKDTDLFAMRADLTTTLQVVAQPPAGKTWALAPAFIRPFEDLCFWNFDSVAHSVELYFWDGTRNILIDTSLAVIGPFSPGPPPAAGEATASVPGLVIPDGSALKAKLKEAPVTGRCLLLAPFTGLNAAKPPV